MSLRQGGSDVELQIWSCKPRVCCGLSKSLRLTRHRSFISNKSRQISRNEASIYLLNLILKSPIIASDFLSAVEREGYEQIAALLTGKAIDPYHDQKKNALKKLFNKISNGCMARPLTEHLYSDGCLSDSNMEAIKRLIDMRQQKDAMELLLDLVPRRSIYWWDFLSNALAKDGRKDVVKSLQIELEKRLAEGKVSPANEDFSKAVDDDSWNNFTRSAVGNLRRHHDLSKTSAISNDEANSCIIRLISNEASASCSPPLTDELTHPGVVHKFTRKASKCEHVNVKAKRQFYENKTSGTEDAQAPTQEKIIMTDKAPFIRSKKSQIRRSHRANNDSAEFVNQQEPKKQDDESFSMDKQEFGNISVNVNIANERCTFEPITNHSSESCTSPLISEEVRNMSHGIDESWPLSKRDHVDENALRERFEYKAPMETKGTQCEQSDECLLLFMMERFHRAVNNSPEFVESASIIIQRQKEGACWGLDELHATSGSVKGERETELQQLGFMSQKPTKCALTLDDDCMDDEEMVDTAANGATRMWNGNCYQEENSSDPSQISTNSTSAKRSESEDTYPIEGTTKQLDFDDICGINFDGSELTANENSSKTHSEKNRNRVMTALRKVFPCATSSRKKAKQHSPLQDAITSDHGLMSSQSLSSVQTSVEDMENPATPMLQQNTSVKIDVRKCNKKCNSYENEKLKFFTSFKQNVLWLPMFSVLIFPR